jgi:hypothetical protein
MKKQRSHDTSQQQQQGTQKAPNQNCKRKQGRQNEGKIRKYLLLTTI